MSNGMNGPVRALALPTSLTGLFTAPVVLAGIVLVSFGMRLMTAFAHATPRYFPDEYIYATLARSLSEGHLTVRGEPAGFPALLEPILAAPAWLVGDTAVAYRLTLGLHAAAWSLAAVPIYFVARRLRLSAWQALACAALTVSVPAVVYSSYVTAEAVALPFALGAVAAGVAALERPTVRSQALFLSLSFLAAFARVQYVVIPVAFVVAAFVVSRGRPGTMLRSFAVVLSTLGLATASGLALGPRRVLGYYEGVLDLGVDPIGLARWTVMDAFLLSYAAGWVLIPAALVGLAYGLARPRYRAELGFAALSAALVAALFLEAAVYASSGAERFQERYLVAALPLLGLLFFLGWGRFHSRGARVAVAALAGGMAAAALAVPLSGFAVGLGKQDSPLLQAVTFLEQLTAVGTASLVIATIALLASGFTAVAALRGWGAAPVAALTLLLLAGSSALAMGYELERSEAARTAFLGEHRDWVDRAGLEQVGVLVTPGSLRAAVSQQLFWNDSLTTLLRMDGAEEIDSFGSGRVQLDRTGSVVVEGRQVTTPLLVQEYASYAELEDAVLVARTANTSLWRPVGRNAPRLSLLATGRYWDGWLAGSSSVTAWPSPSASIDSVLRIPLSLPEGTPAQRMVVQAPGIERRLTLEPGRSMLLELPVRSTTPWTVTLRAETPFFDSGGRLLAVVAGIPRLVSSAASR